ncbi:MAG: hypothetical protein P4L33_20965 [Capsulimonadaceae bacterium]|nr:hypothetical protein [Capsulimonadaceae bacterium]
MNRIILLLTAACAVLGASLPCQALPVAGIVCDHRDSGCEEVGASATQATLERAGYEVRRMTSADLMATTPTPQNVRLLALIDSKHLLASAAPTVEAYLARGGSVIAFDAPAWSQADVRLKDGRVVSAQTYRDIVSALPLHTIVADFASPTDDLPWRLVRSAGTTGCSASIETASPGVDVKGALHVDVKNLHGWMAYALEMPGAASPFQSGDTVTSLWAKGDGKTGALAIEWDERDKSRWIATIPLTPLWRRFTLTPSDFHSWQNPASVAKRGFQPENACLLTVGVNQSHAQAHDGPHQFWVAQIGTMNDIRDAPRGGELPSIDGLSPAYKRFAIGSAVRLQYRTEDGQDFVKSRVVFAPGSLSSAFSRQSGLGFQQGREWRFQPVATAMDAESGDWRGTPVAYVVNGPGAKRYPGAAWETFGMNDAAYYGSAEAQRLVADFARRVNRGLFLLGGGSDSFTYFDGDTVTLGATVIQLAPATAFVGDIAVESEVKSPGGKTVFAHRWPVAVAPGATWTQSVSWRPEAWQEQGYRVTTRLIANGETIDSTSHLIHVLRLNDPPDFVTTGSDGHFHYKGKVWRANGINYRPSSFLATEDSSFYDSDWLASATYDPDIVSRELAHVAALGFNAISIKTNTREIEPRNLLDVLRIAKDLHLHVNLALVPGVPEGFSLDEASKLISDFRLAGNDTVFAYDIAWEPEFRNHVARTKLDPSWREWVTNKYGTLAAAKAAWGISAPLDAKGQLTNPSNEQAELGKGAADALFVADYRRFLDDWEVNTYGPVVDGLHKAAPRQYVSFRMSHAGDPLFNQGQSMPYQFQGLARTVDFLSPEGYGNPGGDAGMQAGCFEIAYARSAAPSLPVIWAEYGVHAWDLGSMSDNAALLEAQGQYTRDFYAMATRAGADGLFVWWYPGGFRVEEGSDFGIVNPDGSDRPATVAIRQCSKQFLNQPPRPEPNSWIEYDRFQYPDDVAGVFNEIGSRFWGSVVNGENVGLRPAANSR